MSGTSTNPLFDVERVFGTDLFGDSETQQLNEALTDLAEGLDRADEPVDDIVEDLRAAAEEAGIDTDAVEQALGDAADDLSQAADDILDDINDALDDKGQDGDADDANGDDGNGTGDDGNDANGTGDDGAGGNGNGDADAVQTAFALVLPANNSGALGFAAARLEGRTLEVQFIVDNVTPGQAHPLHIHGFTDGRTERLAVTSDDADGDGFVETAEGAAAAFGPIIASLTASGAVDPALGGSTDFDVATEAGRIVFSRSYTLSADEAAGQDVFDALQARLDGRVVKLHGLDVEEGAGEGTPNEVNGAGGYANLLPVAAGQFLFLPGLSGGEGAAAAAGPAAFLDGITAFLDATAPFTLKADGSGAIAPDPFLADDTPGITGTTPDGAPEGVEEFVALMLPSNNSGVFGAASITFDEAAGTVAIDLDLAGLEPGEQHAMHIHGFTDDRASLVPNIALDADLDGFVEASEGASVIGPVLLGLTADGSITDASLVGDWPEADANGFVSLQQTYSFDLTDTAEAALFAELQDRMEGRQIQVHGLTVGEAQGAGTTGEVAGEAGFQPLLAVAHGAILSTDGAGGQFAATLGGLLQAAFDAAAAEAGQGVVTTLPDDTLIA